MNTVKICCPVYDQMTWDESMSKSSIEALKIDKNRTFDFSTSICQSTYIAENRNMLIKESAENQAIKQKLNPKFTHWLFIDHDVAFSSWDIEKLLAADKGIISGCYRPKDKPERFVAGWCNDEGKIMDYVPALDVGILEVDWTGAGFLLCKREALEAMEYPWYWCSVLKCGNRALTVGEDVFFCLNARRNLITVYLDTNTILNHEGNRYHANVQNRFIKA
jgi:hypothetical protein